MTKPPLGVNCSHKQNSNIGIYIHIPFCARACSYCDFLKTDKFTKVDVETFFEFLLQSLKNYFNTFVNVPLSYCTVYIGGGTPSLFNASFYKPVIAEIKKHYIVEECTIEANPLLYSEKKFSEFYQVGFDRISLGVQSLCDNTLKTLGRKHNSAIALDSIKAARQAGFTNVQVDLIYGLSSGIRTTTLQHEIDSVITAGATGISGYALSLEPTVPLYNSGLACDGTAILEYKELCNSCSSHDLLQRETSNFSRFETKHNNIYWYGLPYIAFGTGAHGLNYNEGFGQRYYIGLEYSKAHSTNFNFSNNAEALFAITWDAPRTLSQYQTEMIYTLLRTNSGIPNTWLNACFSPENINKLTNDAKIKRAQAEDKIEWNTYGLRLCGQEFFLGDLWASHIINIMVLQH